MRTPLQRSVLNQSLSSLYCRTCMGDQRRFLSGLFTRYNNILNYYPSSGNSRTCPPPGSWGRALLLTRAPYKADPDSAGRPVHRAQSTQPIRFGRRTAHCGPEANHRGIHHRLGMRHRPCGAVLHIPYATVIHHNTG